MRLRRIAGSIIEVIGGILALGVLLLGSEVLADPSAPAPYAVTVFATNPTRLSKPDSITFNASNVFVGYGNGGNPDGSGGATSNIIEYDMQGNEVKNIAVTGHNDGLKINPQTGDLWALQNEDGNATLIIIELDSRAEQTTFDLGTGPHGGGYDDIVFDNQSIFFSASAPTINPNTAPAIVSAGLDGKKVTLSGILNGDASATDVTTGTSVTLNLQDPDSMILDPKGEVVLDSQGDGELVIVQHPGLSCQKAFVVPLSSAAGGSTVGNTQLDDTVFATQSQGRILVADKDLGAVYSITAPYFAPDAAYSAVSVFSSPTAPNPTESFVGQTNLTTGFVTPIVTGMSNPGGMAFIPAQVVTSPRHSIADHCP